MLQSMGWQTVGCDLMTEQEQNTYQISFIHLWINRHLGYFHILAIFFFFLNAEMTINYRYLYKILISFPFYIYSEVGLLDHKVALFLII